MTIAEGGLSPPDVGLVGNIVHAAGTIRLGKVVHLRGVALGLVSRHSVGTGQLNVGDLLGRARQRQDEIELIVQGPQSREEGRGEVGNLVRHGQMRRHGLLQEGMRCQLRGSAGPIQRQVGHAPLQICRQGRILIQDDVGVGNVVFDGTIRVGLLGFRQSTRGEGNVMSDGKLLEGVRAPLHHHGIVPIHQILPGILDAVEVVLDVPGWVGIAKVHRRQLLHGRTRPTLAQMIHRANAASKSLDSQGQDVADGEALVQAHREEGGPDECH
mmetsp:Transcript_16864/g.48449  ORF Transcript_16864/g.48449 Transcript_16864/m.48449 type:complete len:270 (+) Transcript_16864:2136-2945(+)